MIDEEWGKDNDELEHEMHDAVHDENERDAPPVRQTRARKKKHTDNAAPDSLRDIVASLGSGLNEEQPDASPRRGRPPSTRRGRTPSTRRGRPPSSHRRNEERTVAPPRRGRPPLSRKGKRNNRRTIHIATD